MISKIFSFIFGQLFHLSTFASKATYMNPKMEWWKKSYSYILGAAKKLLLENPYILASIMWREFERKGITLLWLWYFYYSDRERVKYDCGWLINWAIPWGCIKIFKSSISWLPLRLGPITQVYPYSQTSEHWTTQMKNRASSVLLPFLLRYPIAQICPSKTKKGLAEVPGRISRSATLKVKRICKKERGNCWVMCLQTKV